MTKIFGVSTGSYSDYAVLTIYTTRERAEAVVAHVPDTQVEEFDLDPGVLRAAEGLKRFFVQLTLTDGDVLRIECLHPDLDDVGTKVQESKGWLTNTLVVHAIDVECWARDDAHAIKIASEHRRVALATAAPLLDAPGRTE